MDPKLWARKKICYGWLRTGVVGMTDYMQKYPTCNVQLTDIRNPNMRVKWAVRSGEAWGCRSDGTPCWLMGLRCHQRRWTSDRRCNNANSRPAPPRLHLETSGRRWLLAGRWVVHTHTCCVPPRKIQKRVQTVQTVYKPPYKPL